MERLADAQKRALEQQAQQKDRRDEIEKTTGSQVADKNGATRSKGPSASVPRAGSGKPGSERAANGPASSARPPSGGGAQSNGDANAANGGKASGNGAPAKPKGTDQSRSRDKRGRRAR